MPRVRLNALNVRSLPPLGKLTTDYFDEHVPGLVLRVSPTRRSWGLMYSRRGKTKRFGLGRLEHVDLAEARKQAKTLLARIALGDDPAAVRAAERAAALTIADLGRAALAALELRPTTEKEWGRLLEREIIPALGDESAAALSRTRIREWGAGLAKRSPSTATHAFEVLRRIYSWAVQTDRLQGSPFVQLPPPAARKISGRVLSTQELRALLLALDELPGAYSDAVLLLLLTMTRREMVLGARQSERDGARWVVPVERSKGGREHVVPLSGPAAAIFDRRAELGDLLFPPGRPAAEGEHLWWSSRYIRDLKRRLDAHLKAKAARWSIHGLRHTAATHLREDLGVDRDVVRLLLAHARLDVSGRYDRAELLQERRGALEAWAAWLDTLRAGNVATLAKARA